MTKTQSPQGRLLDLFDEKKCYTIKQLSQSLDYSVISTRRFLKELGYYSSFTHNSKWYTLHNIPSFNKYGLWFCKDIGFSKHGNLNQTILYFVNTSEQGLTAKELLDIIFVPCHPVLNLMYRKRQIDRSHTPRGFVYLSPIEDIKMLQLDRLQSKVFPAKQIQRLTAQAAVYVLVELIKQPDASFLQLSKAVKKRQIIASEEAIAQLFTEHGIKKISK
jgi:hypothetical protein